MGCYCVYSMYVGVCESALCVQQREREIGGACQIIKTGKSYPPTPSPTSFDPPQHLSIHTTNAHLSHMLAHSFFLFVIVDLKCDICKVFERSFSQTFCTYPLALRILFQF